MNLSVVTTPESDTQIRAIDQWWRTNRPAAPELFAEELANCLVLLEQAPAIGKPYRRHPSAPGLRRLLLRATRYHVYYLPRAEVVTVLAVWHSCRGQLPPL